MKKTFFLGVLAIFILASCNKYPDGPSISFRSKKARLANSWKVQYYSENGVNKTTDFNNVFVNYNIVISKECTYSVTYRLLNLTDYTESGNWSFNDEKKNVLFNPSSPSNASASNWIILKLEEKELWGRDIDTTNNITKEIHLIPM